MASIGPGAETGIDVDLSEFRRFVDIAPREIGAAAERFFERGTQTMRKEMVQQATARFGQETAESRMQTVDPSRPKGRWVSSLRRDINRDRGRVGPTVPYAFWVEWGSEAPQGTIPESHTSAEFIGHRPITRGAREAMDDVERIAFRELSRGISKATRKSSLA